jgi:4'-phosphopantetheinyl transferase
VDIWRVDLREVDEEPLGLLSTAERERAANIANPARRALWMRGRGVLRTLLGSYRGLPAGQLKFVFGEHGKPALAESVLHFNLSHSGPLALYAFTHGAQVGVDLEQERERERARDESALAERLWGADVAQQLRAMNDVARKREFLRLWVRHEAALKCLGGSVLEPPEVGGPDPSLEPWIVELDLGPRMAALSSEMAAAVAVRDGPRELCCWDWPRSGPSGKATRGDLRDQGGG